MTKAEITALIGLAGIVVAAAMIILHIQEVVHLDKTWRMVASLGGIASLVVVMIGLVLRSRE